MFVIYHSFTLLYLISRLILYCYVILAVSTNKSKFGAIVTSASCAAFILLLVGAIFTCRYHQLNKLEHDVFVDVEGKCDR